MLLCLFHLSCFLLEPSRPSLMVSAIVLQAEKLAAAAGYFDATWKKFQEALDILPEADKGKKLKPIQVTHVQSTLCPARPWPSMHCWTITNAASRASCSGARPKDTLLVAWLCLRGPLR